MKNYTHYNYLVIIILCILFFLFFNNISYASESVVNESTDSVLTKNSFTNQSDSQYTVKTVVPDSLNQEFSKSVEQKSKSYRRVIDWYMRNINYFSITLLMTIESSFIPFPSEVVVPPAAWKAAQDGSLNIFLILLFSTFGALLGALINYYLSISLGRVIIYKFADTKFAHILLINKEKIQKAEQYFVDHGKSSTFIGRLVPGIRQLISIPAGLAKMNIGTFIGYTVLGAGIWNAILIALGYFLYSQQDMLQLIYHKIKIVLWIIGILFVVYLIFKSVLKKKKVK